MAWAWKRTVSTKYKGNEEPCSGSDQVVGMEGGHDDEKNNEYHGCCHGGIVFIGFPASVC